MEESHCSASGLVVLPRPPIVFKKQHMLESFPSIPTHWKGLARQGVTLPGPSEDNDVVLTK